MSHFINFICIIIGYCIKYVLDKKFFLYKKKMRARERVETFIGIFAKSRFFYASLQSLNIEKIKNLNDFERMKYHDLVKSIHGESFSTISRELEQLNIRSEVIPYVDNKTKKILEACLCLLTSAVQCLLFITLDYSIIKEDSLIDSFKKYIIPIIPEREKFITDDPITRVWHCDDLLYKKLYEVSNKRV